MSEPIGVMACFECIEKHGRDLEHHLEDLIRVTKEPRQRLYFEEWIDKIREIRKFAHQRAKGIAVAPPVPIPPTARMGESSSNPEWEELEKRALAIVEAGKRLAPAPKPEVEYGEHVWVERNVAITEEECHPESFRVIKPNPEHIITICCPLDHWDEQNKRCLVGTRAYKIEHLHPPEESGSCPVCEGA